MGVAQVESQVLFLLPLERSFCCSNLKTLWVLLALDFQFKELVAGHFSGRVLILEPFFLPSTSVCIVTKYRSVRDRFLANVWLKSQLPLLAYMGFPQKGREEKGTWRLEFVLLSHFPNSLSKALWMGILVKGKIHTPTFELPSKTKVKYTCSILPEDQYIVVFSQKMTSFCLGDWPADRDVGSSRVSIQKGIGAGICQKEHRGRFFELCLQTTHHAFTEPLLGFYQERNTSFS